MTEEDIEVDIEITKPSRADRWKRSVAARLRRQVARFAQSAHSHKEDAESQERLKAKRLIEKQKKTKRKKVVDSEYQSV